MATRTPTDTDADTDTGSAGDVACDGDTVLVPKRIVRLSFNQLSSTIRALFDDTLGRQ